MESFSRFILAHAGDDPARLLLSRATAWPQDNPLEAYASGEAIPEVRALAASTLEVRKRLKTKAPHWYEHPELVYPLRLGGEQCSSEETASRKAEMLQELFRDASGRRPLRVADLTGGLGLDSAAFARVADEVLYAERNPLLCAAARHNFAALGLDNIRVRCAELRPGALARILDGFQADVIYLDPARRDDAGRKVFRLEDCSPDPLPLQDELLGACPHLVMKLSPMADLSYLEKSFGTQLAELRLVEADGECKEILVHLTKTGHSEGKKNDNKNVISNNDIVSSTDTPIVTIITPQGRLCMPRRAEKAAEAQFFPSESALSEALDSPRTRLFEPGKALRKSGFSAALCERFSLTQAGPDCPLYFLPDSDGETPPDGTLSALGKMFRICEYAPLSGATLKAWARRGLCCGVTARGIALRSDGLRTRLRIRDEQSGRLHLFGVRTLSGPLLLLCEREMNG